MLTPTVTPELTRWIVMLAQHGLPPNKTIEAMKKANWAENTAAEVLAVALSEFVRNQTTPQVAPEPGPDLSGFPLEIDVGDHTVRVLMNMQQPRIILFSDFLSVEECGLIMQEAAPRLTRSTVMSKNGVGNEVIPARSSSGMFFKRGETNVLSKIEQRIARIFCWPEENGEGVQVLRYGMGEEYKPHYDYFGPEKPYSQAQLQRGGNRIGTLVMYLNDVPKGGGTTFPDMGGMTVSAARGNAVYFSYPLAHPISKSLHGGSPVLEGEKWVAIKWLRESTFT